MADSREPLAEGSAPRDASVRAYPAAVDRWWLSRGERLGRDEIVRAARGLSDLFTLERPARFSDYAASEAVRTAYGWLYFPQSFVRARFPLADLLDLRGWSPPADRPVRVVDVGAGQGAAGLGVAHLLEARGGTAGVDLAALDRSPRALADLEALHGELRPLWPRTRLRTLALDARGGAIADVVADADLVVVSFALNEMLEAASTSRGRPGWAASLVPGRRPGFLVVIEPATRACASRLDDVASSLVASGAAQDWGPELAPSGKPVEARFWTYESRRWSLPGTVALVNARLWRSLGELTFSYRTLGTTPGPTFPPTPALHRLVSPLQPQKGLLGWAGRASDGEVHRYEVLRRRIPAAHPLLEIERGDVLELTAYEAAADGRVRLPGPDAAVVRHHPA